MDEQLRGLLEEKGDRLAEEYDEETIEAVIEEVEQLDGSDTDKTATLLRVMTGLKG